MAARYVMEDFFQVDAETCAGRSVDLTQLVEDTRDLTEICSGNLVELLAHNLVGLSYTDDELTEKEYLIDLQRWWQTDRDEEAEDDRRTSPQHWTTHPMIVNLLNAWGAENFAVSRDKYGKTYTGESWNDLTHS